ncbi:MAG: 23S rRNA (guanosine(2251)-2'-O)-methyltransferase RlmB [Thermoanaerobaculia bacterium]|nr:23S rRNA (guanosine(2251)-2'-O)-methyltransferase RlmB [Thermoanaerobaculia bacterium]
MKIWGFHPVREALASRPRAIQHLVLQAGRRDPRADELERLAREAGVPVRRVARFELDRLAGKAHNGVAAVLATRSFDEVEECLAGEKGRRTVLLLDEVSDPGNLGAILRSAAALGAAVVIPERHSAPLSETAAKAAAGALEKVRIGQTGNVSQFLARVKEEGFWVYGAAMDGRPAFEAQLSGDVVLCLGAEGTGLRRLTRELCDGLVSIPMVEGAGSLNVSAAAAILLYEIRRQNSVQAKIRVDRGNGS